MPEAPAAPVLDPKAAPAAPADSPLIAGKYKDPAAAETGVRELTKKLGIAPLPDGDLLGPGRLYPDVQALESDLKQKEVLLGKLTAPEKKPDAAPAPDPKQPLKIVAEEPKSPESSIDKDDVDVDTLLTKAGLTKQELYDQWTKDGKLTDDQYAKAKAVGFGKSVFNRMVGTEVAAYQANVDLVQRTAAEAAGGAEALGALLGWYGAKHKGEVAAVADMTKRLNNPATTASAIDQIKFEHAKSNGSDRSVPIVTGTPAGAPQTGGMTDAKEYEALGNKVNSGRASPEEIKQFFDTNPAILVR